MPLRQIWKTRRSKKKLKWSRKWLTIRWMKERTLQKKRTRRVREKAPNIERRTKWTFRRKTSFWDDFNKDYSKRDVKDTAYKEIADVFRCNVTSVKGKINGLRAQCEREMAKVNKTKSGQSTDELFVTNWAHYQSLAFFW